MSERPPADAPLGLSFSPKVSSNPLLGIDLSLHLFGCVGSELLDI